MNKPLLFGLMLAAPVLALPATSVPGTTSKKPPLTGRIAALLDPHLNPAALPVTLPNPFIMVRGSVEFTDALHSTPATPAVRAPAPLDPVPVGDADVLARSVTRLKIGGTMQVNEATQLMINGDLYKEGDHVILDAKPAPIYLQVVQVSPTELTLRYGDATHTIRLKASPKPKDPEP